MARGQHQNNPATLIQGNQCRIIASLKQFLDDLSAEKLFDVFTGKWCSQLPL